MHVPCFDTRRALSDTGGLGGGSRSSLAFDGRSLVSLLIQRDAGAYSDTDRITDWAERQL